MIIVYIYNVKTVQHLMCGIRTLYSAAVYNGARSIVDMYVKDSEAVTWNVGNWLVAELTLVEYATELGSSLATEVLPLLVAANCVYSKLDGKLLSQEAG